MEFHGGCDPAEHPTSRPKNVGDVGDACMMCGCVCWPLSLSLQCDVWYFGKHHRMPNVTVRCDASCNGGWMVGGFGTARMMMDGMGDHLVVVVAVVGRHHPYHHHHHHKKVCWPKKERSAASGASAATRSASGQDAPPLAK